MLFFIYHVFIFASMSVMYIVTIHTARKKEKRTPVVPETAERVRHVPSVCWWDDAPASRQWQKEDEEPLGHGELFPALHGRVHSHDGANLRRQTWKHNFIAAHCLISAVMTWNDVWWIKAAARDRYFATCGRLRRGCCWFDAWKHECWLFITEPVGCNV